MAAVQLLLLFILMCAFSLIKSPESPLALMSRSDVFESCLESPSIRESWIRHVMVGASHGWNSDSGAGSRIEAEDYE